jgi:hypothetical protein
MTDTRPVELIQRRFQDIHGARLCPQYEQYRIHGRDGAARAALGFRRAGDEPLFLERYLDGPLEVLVSEAMGRAVPRHSIIEIGNLAADDAFAMIGLWGDTANDLGGTCEVVAATLTLPLRRMFTRMGVPFVVLGEARCERVGDPEQWGRYYEADPQVCAGFIDAGQRAIARFQARMQGRAAA